MDTEPQHVLLVGGWQSRCGTCRKSCDPQSETHDRLLGYGPENGTPGCGVRWTHKSSDYGSDLADFRPDLIQIGPIL